MRVPVPGRAAPVVKAVSMCNFGKVGSHMIIFPGEASKLTDDFPLSPFLTKELSAFLLFICFLTSSLFDITMKKRLFEF